MKLNQTQRNFILEQVTDTVLSKLKAQAEKLTPEHIKKISGHHRMFNVVIFTDRHVSGNKIKVQCDPEYQYKWSMKDVCAKKTEIKKQLTRAAADLPREWYAEQFDAGHYEVEVDFGEFTCNTVTGPPQFNILWHNEKAERARHVRLAQRGLDKVIQEAVEATQFMHMAAVDAQKFLNKAARKAMLTGVDKADGLLTVLEGEANKL